MNNDRPIGSIIEHVDQELELIGYAPYSKPAFTVLKEKIFTFIGELVLESEKVSKRHRADSVSAAHVEQANQYLTTSQSDRFTKHIGTVGGILLGAGLSNLLGLVTVSSYSTLGVLTTVAFLMVGTCLVAVHMVRS